MSSVRDPHTLNCFIRCMHDAGLCPQKVVTHPPTTEQVCAARRALCCLEMGEIAASGEAHSSVHFLAQKQETQDVLASLITESLSGDSGRWQLSAGPHTPPLDVRALLLEGAFTRDLCEGDKPKSAGKQLDSSEECVSSLARQPSKQTGGSAPGAGRRKGLSGKRPAPTLQTPGSLRAPAEQFSKVAKDRDPIISIELVNDDDEITLGGDSFISARTKLNRDERLKGGQRRTTRKPVDSSRLTLGKGASKGKRKFRPPLKGREDSPPKTAKTEPERDPIMDDERLKNVEEEMVQRILNEVIDNSPSVRWDDIDGGICVLTVNFADLPFIIYGHDATSSAGLEFAKKCIMEIVIYPLLRPDLFTGLRGPPKGLLLFGPPGTGKTLIGKAIASQSGAKFFSISASTLTSKWVGQGEKMVRAMFAVARVLQPTVIFIDEIDSILTQRSEGDFEASRRLKTEFLVQLDGVGSGSEDRILVIGATNRPSEIDEAARRRMVKRLYIPLPDEAARLYLIKHLIKEEKYSLTDGDFDRIVAKTEGYSCSDITALCKDAALGPIRELGSAILETDNSAVRPLSASDFAASVRQIRSSVSQEDLSYYVNWNEKFGSFPSDQIVGA